MLRIIKDENGLRSVVIDKTVEPPLVMCSNYDENKMKKIHHSSGTILHGDYVFKLKIKECYDRVRAYSNR